MRRQWRDLKALPRCETGLVLHPITAAHGTLRKWRCRVGSREDFGNLDRAKPDRRASLCGKVHKRHMPKISVTRDRCEIVIDDMGHGAMSFDQVLLGCAVQHQRIPQRRDCQFRTVRKVGRMPVKRACAIETSIYSAAPFCACRLSSVCKSKSEASWRSCNCPSSGPHVRFTIRPRCTADRAAIASAHRVTCV